MSAALLLRAAGTPVFSHAVRLLERTPEPANLLRVLTYHRVDYPEARPHLNPRLISATPEEFERQMRFVAEHYSAVSIDEVLTAFRGGPPLPPRSVLITFDDGYEDFAQYAWPVLGRHRLPALLFVPTAFPGDPEAAFWGDRLYHAVMSSPRTELRTPEQTLPLNSILARRDAYSCLKIWLKPLPHDQLLARFQDLWEQLQPPPMPRSVLDWSELRSLAEDGLALGAHTRSHVLMSKVDPETALEEAAGSLADLRSVIGEVPPVFAYPSGWYTRDVAVRLPARGFELAFTTVSGVNRLASTDPMRIRRFNVGQKTTLPVLRARLLACTEPLNHLYRLS